MGTQQTSMVSMAMGMCIILRQKHLQHLMKHTNNPFYKTTETTDTFNHFTLYLHATITKIQSKY